MLNQVDDVLVILVVFGESQFPLHGLVIVLPFEVFFELAQIAEWFFEQAAMLDGYFSISGIDGK